MFLLFSFLSLFWTFNYLSWHDECLAIKSQVHLENYWTDLWCFAWGYLPQVGIRTNQPESSPLPGPGSRMPSPGFLSVILKPCPFKVSEVWLIYPELFVLGLSEVQFVCSQFRLLTFELRFPGFWSMFSALHLCNPDLGQEDWLGVGVTHSIVFNRLSLQYLEYSSYASDNYMLHFLQLF